MRLAYLAAQGWPQENIADLCGIGAPQVAIGLGRARAQGFIESAPRFNEELCSPDELKALELFDVLKQLRPNLKKLALSNNIEDACCLQRVQVVPGSASGTAKEAIRERLENFAAFSAPELIHRIAPSKYCGVTWGFTVAKVVEALGHQDPSPLRPHRGRKFISTCGEPYSMEPSSSSSSRIAEQFNAMQEGDEKTVLTLSGIPAFIPPEFDRDTILPFIHKHTAFGRIFGSSEAKRRRAIISKLDTVITSVGAIADPPSTFHGELEKKSGYDADKLKELTYGDIGGASIERSGLDADRHNDFERIANMWIGITHDDLRAVVARAAKNRMKKSGVIVVTIGKNKARIVYEAVRRGLVSELFIDQQLAFALADLCENPPSD